MALITSAAVSWRGGIPSGVLVWPDRAWDVLVLLLVLVVVFVVVVVYKAGGRSTVDGRLLFS